MARGVGYTAMWPKTPCKVRYSLMRHQSSIGRVITHTFFFSSRRRHTRCSRDWSSDVCSSDLEPLISVTHAEENACDHECAEPRAGRVSEHTRDPCEQVAAIHELLAAGGERPRDSERDEQKVDDGRQRSKQDRKSTRLNSSHGYNSYAVFCLTE